MKQIIGGFIIGLFFGVLMGLGAHLIGWRPTIIIFIGAGMVVAVLGYAINLITDETE